MKTPIQLLTDRLYEIKEAEQRAEYFHNKKDLKKIRSIKRKYEIAIHSVNNYTQLSRWKLKKA